MSHRSGTWRRHGRSVAAVIGATVLLPLAAGCGGSGGSPSASGPTISGSAVSFSACMRHHAIAEFPDPDTDGDLPKVGPHQLGVSSSAYQAAREECEHLLQPSTGQARETMNGLRDFAGCMRSRGVPNWPDLTLDNSGRPVFDLHDQVNPDVPPADTTADQCSHLLHPPPGQDGVVLCDGIGESGCHHYGRPQS